MRARTAWGLTHLPSLVCTLLAAALAVAPAGRASAAPAPTMLAVTKLPPPDVAANAAASQPNYVIGPLDQLTVKVYPEADLGGDVQVDVSGKINMPLIGPVVAASKTPGQLSQEIATALGSKYLVNPSVAVSIKDSATNKYTVTGAVAKPGVYNVVGDLTLMQAVAVAQGVSEMANDRSVLIFRLSGGRRVAALVDLDGVERGKLEDPQIYAGDVVVVGTSAGKRFMKNLAGLSPLMLFLSPFHF